MVREAMFYRVTSNFPGFKRVNFSACPDTDRLKISDTGKQGRYCATVTMETLYNITLVL